MKRESINPGIRYEREMLTGTLADLTLNNNWAPRIGVTLDPTGSGKAKIYANWGFFYSKVPNDLAARALSSDAGVSRADYFDAGLTQPVPDGVLGLGTTSHFLQQGVSADTIDPSVKTSYVNEAVTGFEFEAVPGMNVGVRYIHRDIPRVLEDVQPFPIVAGDLGIPGATTGCRSSAIAVTCGFSARSGKGHCRSITRIRSSCSETTSSRKHSTSAGACRSRRANL
jgi:hypothetical protein